MGWSGVGWDVNVHVTLMMLRCSWGLGWGHADDVTLHVGVGVGWGGVGWDVNVHVTLMMLRCSWGLGWGGVGCQCSCYADSVSLLVGVGVGWGGMLTFMLRWWCYAARGGWGGVGCWRSCFADSVTDIDVLFPWSCATRISSLEMWLETSETTCLRLFVALNWGNANTLKKLADLASTCWDRPKKKSVFFQTRVLHMDAKNG